MCTYMCLPVCLRLCLCLSVYHIPCAAVVSYAPVHAWTVTSWAPPPPSRTPDRTRLCHRTAVAASRQGVTQYLRHTKQHVQLVHHHIQDEGQIAVSDDGNAGSLPPSLVGTVVNLTNSCRHQDLPQRARQSMTSEDALHVSVAGVVQQERSLTVGHNCLAGHRSSEHSGRVLAASISSPSWRLERW